MKLNFKRQFQQHERLRAVGLLGARQRVVETAFLRLGESICIKKP
jgi:hypothetical protein